MLPSILGYNGLLVRGGALESFLLEAATQNKALDAEQLRFIQTSRDKQQS